MVPVTWCDGTVMWHRMVPLCVCLIDKSQAVSISPTIAQNSMACLYFKEKIEIGKIRKCTMGGKIKKWID